MVALTSSLRASQGSRTRSIRTHLVTLTFVGVRKARLPELLPSFQMCELEIEDLANDQLEGIRYHARRHGTDDFEVFCLGMTIAAEQRAEMSSPTTDVFERLQRWYLAECNDDWEHSYGVKIDTLDNPGWIVTIDLLETSWADLVVERELTERSEHDWVQHEVAGSRFVGCGGPMNLTELLELFFRIVDAHGSSPGPLPAPGSARLGR